MAGAARAQVHDGGRDSLAVVLDVDLLSAPGVGGLTCHSVVGGGAPGVGSEGNDHVGGVERLATGTKGTGERVDGQVTGEGLARAGAARAGGVGAGRGRGSVGDGSNVGSRRGGWHSCGRGGGGLRRRRG